MSPEDQKSLNRATPTVDKIMKWANADCVQDAIDHIEGLDLEEGSDLEAEQERLIEELEGFKDQIAIS